MARRSAVSRSERRTAKHAQRNRAGHIPMSVSVRADTETVTCLRLPGPGLFVANYTGRPFGFEDLVRAANVGTNDSAATALDLDWYLATFGLGPTLETTRRLLGDMFGAGSTVIAHVEADVETGVPELVFDLITPSRPSFADRERFLDRFLAEVPKAAGAESPILVWNPTRADIPA